MKVHRHPTIFPLFFLLVLLGCEKTYLAEPESSEQTKIGVSQYRTKEQVVALATSSLSLISGVPTKSCLAREIESVQCLIKHGTKGDSAKEDTLVYVVNFKNNDGFSLISAKKNKTPILAVTESGHYDLNNGTGVEAVDFFLSAVCESQRFRPDDPIILDNYWDEINVADSCVTIMPTKWGQRDIYGQYCPNGISGCVATALGQILAFKQMPASFVTTVAMGDDYVVGQTISPGWSLIGQHVITHYDSLACNPVHNQIGALLREIGAQVSMSYNTNSSSAYISNVPNLFSAWGINHGSSANANTTSMRNSISNGCPVFMWGNNTNGVSAHAWVADGYKYYDIRRIWYGLVSSIPELIYAPIYEEIIKDQKLLHINWGWDGVCNGYFNFDCYDSSSAVQYDGISNFVANSYTSVKMICNIGMNNN